MTIGEYASTYDLQDEIERLREENARLRTELERLRPKPAKSASTSK